MNPKSSAADDSDLQIAFGLLADIVREMHAGGKRTYSAAVKPQLLARTNGGFDESSLGPGFPSFRAFLNAAADAGVVLVSPAPVGPDVEILPPGATSLGPKSHPTRTDTLRIRKEFWDAFIDWTPGQLRAYDRNAGAVRSVSLEPAPLEPASQTILRRSMQNDAARWVEITPLTFKQQLGIMQAYVDELAPSPQQAALQTALMAEKPVRAFTNTLTIDAGLRSGFQAHRLQAVADVISEWMAEHGLEVEVFESPVRPPERDTHAPVASGLTVLDAARALVHAAVDRMPLEELNRLQIPIEYHVES